MQSTLEVDQPLTNTDTPSQATFHTHTGDECPSCGISRVLKNAEHARVTELEAQVRILTNKATDAADKVADYEEELRKLKSQPPNTSAISTPAGATANGGSVDPSNPSPLPTPTDESPKPLTPSPAPSEGTTLSYRPSVKARFPSFLTRSNSRSPANAPANTPTAATPTPRENDLTMLLSQERTLREAAEGKVVQMSSEMEDLSVTLFQQANEMVSTEREARAKLEERAARFEERCGVLEEKVKLLEKRDGEKLKRLERLESAVIRIQRVRKVLDVKG